MSFHSLRYPVQPSYAFNPFFYYCHYSSKPQLIYFQMSRALQINFDQFCQIQYNQLTSKQDSASKEQKKSQRQQVTVENISSTVEFQNDQKSLEEYFERSQKQPQKPTEHPTSDNSLESSSQDSSGQENEQSAIESHSKKLQKRFLIKKNRDEKQVIKKKKNTILRPSIELDLNQNAALKSGPLTSQEISRKRKALLLRKVENWQQAAKGRKQRRQVRMLTA